MPRPYSTDLREERAVESLVESGASRREIAERMFKVGVSSVVRWCQRWSETGSAAPKRSGGSVSPLEEHSDWIPCRRLRGHDKISPSKILASGMYSRRRGYDH